MLKIDKELNNKIDQSATTIEKNKIDSLKEIQNQISEITKLTLSKVAVFKISDDEVNTAIKNVERSLN